VLTEVLEDADNEMNTLARLALQRLQEQWREIDAHLAWCDQRIAVHGQDPRPLPRPQRWQPRPARSEQRIHHAAGISQKTQSNRSDRQRASSTNPWWLDSSVST
jgi:hypothetical protein